MSEDNQRIKRRLVCSFAVLNRLLGKLEDDSNANERPPLYLRFSQIGESMQEILLAEEFNFGAAAFVLQQYDSELEISTTFFEGPQK